MSIPWPYATPATERNTALIEFSGSLNGAPQCDEYEKMISGMLYNPFEPALEAGRHSAHCLSAKYNNTDLSKLTAAEVPSVRARQLEEMLGKVGEGAFVEAPFYVDYGCNVSIGRDTFINWGMTILDTSLVVIGERVLFGTNVSLITASHETSVRSRRSQVEFGHPIFIGDDCWIAANVTILPGVRIGEGSTVGAGSVVTRDVPAYSVAVGNPARVRKQVKTLQEEEQEEEKEEEEEKLILQDADEGKQPEQVAR